MKTFYASVSANIKSADSAPTDEENISCLKRAVKGNSDESLDEFILTNIRLVGGVIARFTNFHSKARYLYDDMYSAGLLALTAGVQILVRQLRKSPEKLDVVIENWGSSSGDGINFVGYLYIAIYRAVQNCYEIESTDVISKQLRQRHTPKGCDTPTRKVNMPEEYFDSLQCDPFSQTELMEDILGTCRNEAERLIVESGLWCDRDSLQVMAKKLGTSCTSVWRKKRALYKRYCQERGIPM